MYHRKEKYLIHVKKMTKTDVFVLQKYRNAVIFLKRKIMYSILALPFLTFMA